MYGVVKVMYGVVKLMYLMALSIYDVVIPIYGMEMYLRNKKEKLGIIVLVICHVFAAR